MSCWIDWIWHGANSRRLATGYRFTMRSMVRRSSRRLRGVRRKVPGAWELLVSGKRSLEPQTSTQSNESMPGNGDALLRLLQQQQQMLERMAVFEAASTPISQDDEMNALATHNELPKIQIKRFSGDYKEWPAFWDI